MADDMEVGTDRVQEDMEERRKEASGEERAAGGRLRWLDYLAISTAFFAVFAAPRGDPCACRRHTRRDQGRERRGRPAAECAGRFNGSLLSAGIAVNRVSVPEPVK